MPLKVVTLIINKKKKNTYRVLPDLRNTDAYVMKVICRKMKLSYLRIIFVICLHGVHDLLVILLLHTMLI